jgi:putative tricarboxylic transport membrane protein
MRKKDLCSSLFFFLFGVSFIIGSLSYPTWDRYGPGPGFFPLLLGVLFSALSLLLLIRSVARQEEGDKKEGGSQFPILRAVVYLFVLFGFYFFFERLGFILTLFLFMSGVLYLFGRRSIRSSLSISVLATFFAYLVFVKLLSVPLPPGILKDVIRLY